MKLLLLAISVLFVACNTLPDETDPEQSNQGLINLNNPDVGHQVALMGAAQKAKEKYLATKYPGERGQSLGQLSTLYAAILDVAATAKRDSGGAFASEYGTVTYKDKYNYNYYIAPKRGEKKSDGSWVTVITNDDYPGRPELKDGATNFVHSHVTTSPTSPSDNSNPFPSWVVTSDSKVWVYPPQSTKVKPYGSIENGHIVTAYNDLDSALNPNYDIYAQMTDPDGYSCNFWCWAAVVSGVVAGGTVGAVVGGMATTTSPGCCFGPPASGYDPTNDPTQICRQPNGGNCT